MKQDDAYESWGYHRLLSSSSQEYDIRRGRGKAIADPQRGHGGEVDVNECGGSC